MGSNRAIIDSNVESIAEVKVLVPRPGEGRPLEWVGDHGRHEAGRTVSVRTSANDVEADESQREQEDDLNGDRNALCSGMGHRSG